MRIKIYAYVLLLLKLEETIMRKLTHVYTEKIYLQLKIDKKNEPRSALCCSRTFFVVELDEINVASKQQTNNLVATILFSEQLVNFLEIPTSLKNFLLPFLSPSLCSNFELKIREKKKRKQQCLVSNNSTSLFTRPIYAFSTLRKKKLEAICSNFHRQL